MAAYLDQFATAFLVVGGSQPFSEEDALALLAPLLREGGFSSSVYPTIKAMEVRMAEDEEFGGGSIVSGPWTGTETTAVFPILTALKWNLRTRTQGRGRPNGPFATTPAHPLAVSASPGTRQRPRARA